MGWITCDNASNNQTMMESLEYLLKRRKIPFNAVNCRIWFENQINPIIAILIFSFFSCFPHIVNLACRAVLAAITNLEYVDDTVQDYQDYEPGIYSAKDCIATVRSLVNSVSFYYYLISLLLKDI
jgi:hypothetical protein